MINLKHKKELILLLDRVVNFLMKGDALETWVDMFLNKKKKCQNSSKQEELSNVCRDIIGSYAGMCSFSDVYLVKNHSELTEDNKLLSSLKEQVYNTCTEVITYGHEI